MSTTTLHDVEQIMGALRASTVQVNGQRRSITSRYVLADLPDSGRETGRQAVLKVTTYHYGDRKRYSTSVRHIVASRSGAFTVEAFDLMSGVGLISTPVARHSAKAMAAAHASGLQVLEIALLGNHPEIMPLLSREEPES